MGKPVPVNLSNGEYQMPPEQVHAVGAQVLDQMKDATHAPAAAQGFKPQEGELFFADGGVVESTDDLIARISAKYGTGSAPAPRPQPVTAAPQQPVQRPAAPSISSAVDAIRNRKRQIDEAAGFADGGLVDEERRRTGPSPQMGAVALGNQARVERSGGQGMYEGANSEIARGFRAAFPSTDTAIRGASQNIAESYQKGGIPAAIGATVRNTAVPALGLADDIGRGVKTLIDPAANALKTAVTGDATPIEGARPAAGFSAQPRPQPATSVAADPQRQADDPVRAPTAAAPQGFSPSALTEKQRNDAGDAYRSAWQREAPTGMRGANDQALALYNAEQQVRGSNISARRGANGVMEFSGNGEGALPQNYTQGVDMALGNERMARANAIRAGNAEIRDQIGFNSGASLSRQKTQDEIVRELLTGPSRSGRQAAVQMIDNQRQAERDTQQMALDERRVGIDQQRADAEGKVRGAEARRLERVERLYAAYENAKTPEERAAVAEQIRAMNGKEPSEEWKPVSLQGGTDAMGNRTESILAAVNSRTGEMRRFDGGQQQIPSVPPKDQLRVGQVYQTARGPARWDGKQFVVTGQ
ncbi:MAG: hypothetical protein RBT67_02820 [Thauera sp.]|nr:hypothetical protein [Thauera sp.]